MFLQIKFSCTKARIHAGQNNKDLGIRDGRNMHRRNWSFTTHWGGGRLQREVAQNLKMTVIVAALITEKLGNLCTVFPTRRETRLVLLKGNWSQVMAYV